jgi:RNA polymerase sigma-70 factor (ECF subfamily)
MSSAGVVMLGSRRQRLLASLNRTLFMNEMRTRVGLGPSQRLVDAGDGDWIELMVNRYERPLLAYACRMLSGDQSRAQDAVQETFLRLCREDRQQIESRIAAWLFSVCRTRVIDMQRSPGHAMNSLDCLPVVDPSPDASQLVESAEQTSKLAAMVSTLTPRQQEVLRLRLQADLSYREIAEITGLTVSNVGFHLHAAVRSLRDSMNVSTV